MTGMVLDTEILTLTGLHLRRGAKATSGGHSGEGNHKINGNTIHFTWKIRVGQVLADGNALSKCQVA